MQFIMQHIHFMINFAIEILENSNYFYMLSLMFIQQNEDLRKNINLNSLHTIAINFDD